MTINHYRQVIADYLHNSAALQVNWQNTFYPEILNLTQNLTNGGQVLALGEHLTDIFFLARNAAQRNQGGVSSAGEVWENLVLTYLNMVFSGTNGIAFKLNNSLCPQNFKMATSVWYGNNKTNKETDLAVAIFPDDMNFPAPDRDFIRNLNAEVALRINDIEYGIVQCKTNWNENAQIPMLWDMIYRSYAGRGQNRHAAGVRVGEGQFSINNFRNNGITYSFVTAPTQTGQFSANLLPVQRVRNLSGGNYWGKRTVPGVARSLGEIFVANFTYAFRGAPIQASINNAIAARDLDWVAQI